MALTVWIYEVEANRPGADLAKIVAVETEVFFDRCECNEFPVIRMPDNNGMTH